MMRGVVLALLLAQQAAAGPVPAACEISADLCAVFRAALAEARPGHPVAATTDAQAIIRLVVLGQASRRFTARVDWRNPAGEWQLGRPRAAAIAGRPLTPEMRHAVIDALVRDAITQGALPPG